MTGLYIQTPKKNIMKNLYNIVAITIAFLAVGHVSSQCDYTFSGTDAWGDGWNGASIDVYANGVNVANWTVAGSSATDTYTATDGDEMEFLWNTGTYDSECSFSITSPSGGNVWSGAAPGAGIFAIDLFSDPSCGPPPPPSCHATGTRADGVNVVIDMVDSYGDGWDGAYLGVCKNGVTTNETFSSGASAQVTLTLTTGDTYSLTYNSGSFENEHSYTVTVDGVIVYSDGPNPTTGDVLYGSYLAAPLCSGTPDAGTVSASLSNSCPGTTVTLTASGYSMDDGVSYQWLEDGAAIVGGTSASVDVNPMSTSSYTFTATCSSNGLTGSSSAETVTVYSSCYDAPSTGNTQILTCSGNIYDDGGIAGNYSSNADGSLTIYPDGPGNLISISGSIDTESGYDAFKVFDGTSTSATELVSIWGTGGGLSYTATNLDGALTVQIVSDGSVQRGGFEFTISCVTTCSGTPATGTASLTAADDCAATAGTIAIANAGIWFGNFL